MRHPDNEKNYFVSTLMVRNIKGVKSFRVTSLANTLCSMSFHLYSDRANEEIIYTLVFHH